MPGFSTNFDKSVEGVALNDLYIDELGNLAINSGNDEIIETCYHAVQLTIGDYDFNTAIGIPYDTYLSSDKPIGNKLKLSIIQALQGVEGVTSVLSFSANINRQTRQLQITAVVNLLDDTSETINVLTTIGT